MAEQDLDRRLLAVARAFDAEAPAFDGAVLRRGRPYRSVVLVAVVAVVGAFAAPGAVSGLGHLFGVDSVSGLGSVAPDVAPAYLGRQVSLDTLSFSVAMIPSLGAPTAYVRDDFVGGMVILDYGNVRLTQWQASALRARAAVVRAGGTADDVAVGPRHVRGLWLDGAARGTFTVVGADRELHRETFEVGTGALLWQYDGTAYLLQGAGTKAAALELAGTVRSRRGKSQ